VITDSIKQILINKGITRLYHANTVATACTFIKQHGLLSRGAVRDFGLYQTPQSTDISDQEFDVFYDIFFDSVDIHQRSKNINYYGPVTFVFSINVLDCLSPSSIRITKNNPIYWDYGMSDAEKYFLETDDIMHSFTRGDFKQHITLRHQTNPIPFDFLEMIIIDNPKLADNSCFIHAHKYLHSLLTEHKLNIPLRVRECNSNCNCKNIYESYSAEQLMIYFNPEEGK